MNVLGIETTCDETSASVVSNGTRIITNVVSTSLELQSKYGGIVPEVAAREQVKLIVPVIDEAVGENKVDAVAVAYGPGLAGSLLVGVEAAKTLSLAWNVPLIRVNHLFGHIYANWVGENVPKFPLIALIVSGGHTDLLLMKGHGKFKWLGGTRDDAAGEAFDKISRLLGLGYPGGPGIEKEAAKWKGKTSLKFPRPLKNSGDFDFSFSGLKTAVAYLVEKSGKDASKAPITFEAQEAIVDVLTTKAVLAARKFKVKNIVVGGGVSANFRLRDVMKRAGEKEGLRFYFPEKRLSTDNGAMIASAAYYNQEKIDPLKLTARPDLYFD
ncbi:MAG: tRNA (adenosine(37)-N6)-threonylcarbamoyltransferase complex transferase subunit TsaD [Candidatus Curtissbacteria bacterium]|nr:tRNA (adenosine(37)-N6)-threonylcarbamoyltransferase complex transferase subunit TsaD [Candidatus Curtissbacteria bacterium]